MGEDMNELMKKMEEVLSEIEGKMTHDDLEKIQDLSEIQDSRLRDSINELIFVLRVLLKQMVSDEVKEKLANCLGNALAERIIGMTEQSLEYYYAMAPIRNIEGEKNETVSNIISFVFNKYILRYEKNYFTAALEYGLEGEELKKIARCLDVLVSYYVQKHYGRQTIAEDLKDETGLDEGTIDIIVNLIEENYQKLQFNEILDHLSYLGDRVADVESL